MTVLEVFNKYSSKKKDDLLTDFFNSFGFLNNYIENEVSRKLGRFEVSSKIIEGITLQLIVEIKNMNLSYVCDEEFIFLEKNAIVNSIEDFFLITNDEEYIEYFFSKYEILNINIIRSIDTLIDNTVEIINNLTLDFDLICEKFSFDYDFELTDIILFAGDKHFGNKSVAILEFNILNRIVYKPRSLNNENIFYNCISQLNSIGLNIKTYCPKYLDHESHSWMEFVENKPTPQNKISGFYEELGKALAIFYILGTSDIISDNFICSYGILTFFDLECLSPPPTLNRLSNRLLNRFLDSTYRIGITPKWVKFANNAYSMSSALLPVSNIKDKGFGETLNPSTRISYFESKKYKNLPQNENGEIFSFNSSDLETLIKGFENGLRFILNNKEAVTIIINNQYENTKSNSRIILHDTAVYEMIINNLHLPYYQLNQNNYAEYFDVIKSIRSLHTGFDETILSSIANQIKNNDIPIFYVSNTGVDLLDQHHNILIENFYWEKQTPIKNILERINLLNVDVIKFQIDILKNSYGVLFDIVDDNEAFNEIRLKTLTFKSDNLYPATLQVAIDIANDLIEHSLINIIDSSNDDFEINWLSKVSNQESGLWEYSVMNYDLYDGISGIAIFLLSLYEKTGDIRFKLSADKIFITLSKQFSKQLKLNFYQNNYQYYNDRIYISPFSFPCSILLINEYYKCNFDFADLYNENINNILEFLNLSLETNINNDILFGSSGLLIVLSQINNDKIKPYIELCINNLKDNSIHISENSIAWNYVTPYEQKPMNGFAHGSSGIIAALSQVNNYFNEELTTELIHKALNFDRTFYNDQIKGFCDGRYLGENIDTITWCHASPGIALSRLLMPNSLCDSRTILELEIVGAKIIESGLDQFNLLMCHGSLSNAEILKAIGIKIKNESFIKIAEEFVSNTAKYILNGDIPLASKHGIKNYSLFIGNTGIGYQMLRFANWANTPSIISLETCSNKFINLH